MIFVWTGLTQWSDRSFVTRASHLELCSAVLTWTRDRGRDFLDEETKGLASDKND